jgi:hypothetical protein
LLLQIVSSYYKPLLFKNASTLFALGLTAGPGFLPGLRDGSAGLGGRGEGEGLVAGSVRVGAGAVFVPSKSFLQSLSKYITFIFMYFGY